MATGLSLVDFLGDLRRDLVSARQRAMEDALERVTANQPALWLEVGEVSVTVEVAHTSTVMGEVSAEVEGKFWVFGSAKASATAGGESSRTGTQTLTLRLTPRFEELVTDDQGRTRLVSRTVQVAGVLAEGEQTPPRPNPTDR